MDKIKLWVYRILGLASGVGAVVGVTKGTANNIPYDERTYFLAIAILSLICMFSFFNYVDKIINKERKD